MATTISARIKKIVRMLAGNLLMIIWAQND